MNLGIFDFCRTIVRGVDGVRDVNHLMDRRKYFLVPPTARNVHQRPYPKCNATDLQGHEIIILSNKQKCKLPSSDIFSRAKIKNPQNAAMGLNFFFHEIESN